MKYTILSVCTGDYFYEAFDITVPSWFKENCEKIVVYTDKEFSCPGVEIRPELNKSSGWLEAVGLKTVALNKFLSTWDGGNLVFFDMDTYMVHDIAEIFNEHFSIAVSHLEGKATASSGTWYAKVLPRVNCPFRRFAIEWLSLQYHHFKDGKGVIAHKPSYHQIAFTDLLSTLEVYYFPGEIYNSRRMMYDGRGADKKHEAWKQDLDQRGAKVLHFIHDSWRDKAFVKEMAAAAGEFNYWRQS